MSPDTVNSSFAAASFRGSLLDHLTNRTHLERIAGTVTTGPHPTKQRGIVAVDLTASG